MRFIKKLFKWVIGLSILGAFVGVAALAAAYYHFKPELPDIDALREVKFQTPLRVYTADSKLIAEFGEMRRTPINFDEIPQDFVHALQAAEDARFFEHQGIDIVGLLRAAYQLVSTGQIQSGGSTITMQVAKNFFLSRERTFERKFIEILLALRIEQELSKQEIFELYINKIYLGQRAYGIQAAARVYYGTGIDQLNIAQLAMIAGLPKAPSRNNPISNPERSVDRRNWIIGRMLALGYINQEQHDEAVAAPVTASYHGADIEVDAPYVAEMVRGELFATYGEALYTEGLSVYTTINSQMQVNAETALRNGLIAYSERHGYRGPEEHYDVTALSEEALSGKLKATPTYADLKPALVLETVDQEARILLPDGTEAVLPWSAINWAKAFKTVNATGPEPALAADVLTSGDLIRVRVTDEGLRLAQIPEVQGAFVSLNPEDGGIRALTGGFSFYLNKFNRAVQAYRQPGSNMKPMLYSYALSKDFTPASVINDAPVVLHDVSLEANWRPENDNGTFGGPTRLREGLYRSRNLISIRLMRALGIKETRDFIIKFGFEPERFPENLSLALGSAEATPIQVATAYAVLANGGFKVSAYLISKITSIEGETIFTANPMVACANCPERTLIANTSADPSLDESLAISTADGRPLAQPIIDKRTAYLIYDMMRDVIKRGTGRRALVLERGDLAGKTGTTNEQKDAWFSGFNTRLSATAWVGYDQPAPLGRNEYGSTAALPIWIDFMREALAGTPESLPEKPLGVVSALIDPTSGKKAYAGQTDAIMEFFKEEDVPKQLAESPQQQNEAPTSETLFR